jgi:hypothetical protein
MRDTSSTSDTLFEFEDDVDDGFTLSDFSAP